MDTIISFLLSFLKTNEKQKLSIFLGFQIHPLTPVQKHLFSYKIRDQKKTKGQIVTTYGEEKKLLC